MYDANRLKASEREAMMRMALAEDFLLKNKRDLDSRLMRIHRGHNLISVICGMIRKLNLLLYGTIPEDQMKSFTRNIQSLTYCIGVQRPQGNDRSGDFGLWLSFDTINVLLDALKDHCLMCNLDTVEQRKCPLAKALDEVGNNIDDKHTGFCRYKGVL